MSKLLDYYNELKKKDCEKIYVFKVGAFYNCINEDAKKVSENIGLKLTNYQKKNIKIQDINDNGEKFFKLVEVIGDDKKFPTKDKDRTIGEIRVKERVS